MQLQVSTANKSAFTNNPLSALDLRTSQGRRMRDLFSAGWKESGGGRLTRDPERVTACWLWVQLQHRLETLPPSEAGTVLIGLSAECRHAWKALGALKKRRHGSAWGRSNG
jgi:hypothetical protein